MANELNYRVFDFSGGLASNYANELINDNEQKDIINLVYDERGNFKKRDGLKIFSSIPGYTQVGEVRNKVVQIYTFVKYQTGKEEFIVLYEDGSAKGYDGTNLYNFTFTGSSFTPTTATLFTFNDVLYMVDTVNGAFKYAGRSNTGTTSETFTHVPSIPKTNMVIVKNNRVFYAGDPLHPDYLYFSQLANADSVDMTINDYVHGGTTVVGGGGIIRVVSEDARITGLVEFNGALVIFKPDRAYTLTGTDPNNDFRLNTLNVATGCIAPRTVHKGNNIVYWLSKEGVYNLTSPQQNVIQAKPLSVKVNDQIDISKVDEMKTHAYFDGKKYMLIIDPDEDKMLLFDEVSTSWSKFDFSPRSIDYSPKNKTTYYLVGEHIKTLEKGQLKDEIVPAVYEPIHGKLTTAYFRLGEPEITKRFRYVMIFFKPNSVENSEVKLKVEIDYKDSYRSIDAEYIGMTWGTGKWGEMYWGDTKDELNQQIRFGGMGKMIRLTFENDRLDEDMEIHGFVIGYKKKSRVR